MTNVTPPQSLRPQAATFGLTTEEYDLLIEGIGREPNALEAAIVGAMWSEHCGYKNSRPLFRAFPTTGPQVLQGPGENAGVVDIGEGWGVAFKMESHNHPSAVEPVQGAATGVGGILRDIFAMGARPFAVLDSLRFGNPDSPRTRFLLNGVVEGISHYGNAIGVPTVGGEVTFHPSYQENPLVNVMALGLLRHEDLAKGTMGAVGNQIVYVGSKTGRDGLGGAVFSSADLSAASQADRPAVQVGDPFMEKLLLEATLEAIQAGLVAGVQDMGAAGLVSSTCEMAYRAGLGITMDLDLVPTRESGMVPMELCLSESQERMILVPVPGREQELLDLLAKWELDVVTIGEVEAHDRYRLTWKGEVVCDLPVALLNEAPKYTREGVESEEIKARRERDLSGVPVPGDLGAVLVDLLSHPTIASKRPIFERYDYQVMTNTVLVPGAADAAVLRVKGSRMGVAATSDCNPRFVYLDPYKGAAAAVAEAARNLACVGATPLAITDNLNFGNPHNPEVYFQLQQAVQGIADACRALNTPVTGGNVSLYNQYTEGDHKVAIHPTPTIGMVGVLPDVTQRATMNLKAGPQTLYLLGRHATTIGASQYLETVHGLEAGQVPDLDLELEKRVIKGTLALIRAGLTTTAHDCSEGGLAVALAEMAIAGGQGLKVELKAPEGARPDAVLFGEAHSRVIVAIPLGHEQAAQEVLDGLGVPYTALGESGVGSDRVTISVTGANVQLSVNLETLRTAFETPLREILA
ncbi:phosphoribosylformylglycinamidine synthase subunit PurL [Deinococcus metallilatus]|uniref:Phosphoribosylformylglycinamidine synthase subunit PurL n=1 Tax=Deinococcus metallilatus TaxID=1211322 RepID=A0AAJ5K607_9DEIO|nr:phosphoribosylformylglycinamidine synthase subunit PurL [Deinococcus metallilatus]MBB5294539.1 phosphoribosylformylglycinamidine synthase [Deinococcus metallilatus]QBY07585.1 phosphoribosylformylglycinamidine synthase subunit PurL [Deinococcus metallilatus]RXJ14001.1 phosphoribosylformylglycinamidine synthase subunit PurL [Deinococcus metallilatus]TLK29966.1 phosphoribosylformylglycinamidine synthase subunit PurL [Deinococcus metallilatus]GMA15753.1 phosphoribosylformylglycinamidine synthas